MSNACFDSITEGIFIFSECCAEICFFHIFFQTPLHRASYSGSGDIVVILLRNGANVNEKDVREVSDFERHYKFSVMLGENF